MLGMRISRGCPLSRYCHTAPGAQPQSRCQTFEQDLAPEAHEPRRAASGFGADPTGLLDQTLLLDETPKILLVQPHPRQRLDRALQL